MLHHFAVFALCLITAGGVFADQWSGGTYCSNTNINRCMNPFVTKWGQQDGASFFVTGNKQTQESMNLLCSDFLSAKNCINSFMSSCRDENKLILEGLYNMYGYICGKGLKVYLRNQECLAKPELVSEITTCNNTATQQMKDIQQRLRTMQLTGFASKSDVDEQKQKFCKCADELHDCLKFSATRQCNKEAGDFAANIFDRILSPVFSALDCDANANLMLYATIGTTVVVLGGALLALGVGIYVWNRRKRMQGHSYSDRAMLTTNAMI